MKTNLFKTYLIISLSVLLLITLTAGIYLGSVYKNNSKVGLKTVNKLKTDLTTVYLAEGSFSSNLFKNRVKKAVSDNNRIYSVIISDKNNNVKYLYIKSRKHIKTKPEPDSMGNISYPEYTGTGFSYSVLNDSFIIPGHDTFNIEILYKIVSDSEIIRLIKISIIFLLVFIIVSIIFILYMPQRNKTVISVNTYRDTDSNKKEKESDITEKQETAKPDKGDNNLVWEEYLEKKLKYELEKAASFDLDVSFAIISFENSGVKLKQIKKDLIDTVNSYFSLDLSFEYGKKGLALIMPDKELETGISEVKAFLIRLEQLFGADNLKSGLSSRNGRILSPTILIKEAEGALNKAFSEPERDIIAFRSDPEKYREYISSKNFNT